MYRSQSIQLVTTLFLFFTILGSVPLSGQDSDSLDQTEQDDDRSLDRIEFRELPTAVAKKAHEEFPEERLLGVEVCREDGRLTYHVMFEVEGTESGIAFEPDGEIIDRWHFKDTSVTPTHLDIRYGPHRRNVLDLWIAESTGPTPLLLCIHGGGFSGGDKSGFHKDSELIVPMLEAGISVATINYRLTEDGRNPYPIPMLDGARAVQYLRYHAKRFNLDKSRFGATGGSAGGCMLMWIGFHPDLAQPRHSDPVLRESSRLQVLAPYGGQTCLHLPTLEKWFGVSPLPIHPAYHPLFKLPHAQPVERTSEFLEAMLDASPITHLTGDDPPIYLAYGETAEIEPNLTPGRWVHHPLMGIKLKEAMDELGVECHVQYEGGEANAAYPSQLSFLVDHLTNGRKPSNQIDLISP